jgi:hypothetical protein
MPGDELLQPLRAAHHCEQFVGELWLVFKALRQHLREYFLAASVLRRCGRKLRRAGQLIVGAEVAGDLGPKFLCLLAERVDPLINDRILNLIPDFASKRDEVRQIWTQQRYRAGRYGNVVCHDCSLPQPLLKVFSAEIQATFRVPLQISSVAFQAVIGL